MSLSNCAATIVVALQLLSIAQVSGHLRSQFGDFLPKHQHKELAFSAAMDDILYSNGLRLNFEKNKFVYRYSEGEGVGVKFGTKTIDIEGYKRIKGGIEPTISLKIFPAHSTAEGCKSFEFGNMTMGKVCVNGLPAWLIPSKLHHFHVGRDFLLVAEKKYARSKWTFQLKDGHHINELAEKMSDFAVKSYWSLTANLFSFSKFEISAMPVTSIFNHISQTGKLAILGCSISFCLTKKRGGIIVDDDSMFAVSFDAEKKIFNGCHLAIPLQLVLPLEYASSEPVTLPDWEGIEKMQLDPFDNHEHLIQLKETKN